MVPQEDGKKMGTSTASDLNVSWPLSSSSISEYRKSGESKVVQSGKISNSLNKTLPPLMTSPFLLDRKYLKDMESAGYHGVIVKKEVQENRISGVNVKKELQEHRISQGSKLYEASTDLPSSHYMTESQRSPHHEHSETRGHSLSPYNTSAGLDMSKSPSGTSHDDASSITHEDQYERKVIQEEMQMERCDVENGQDSDTEKNELAGNGGIRRGERSGLSGQDDLDSMDVNESTSLPMSQDTPHHSATNGENKLDFKDGVEGGETKCEICGKNFPSSWQLHVHKQIHTKFKPYACRFCGDRFSKAGLRITHERAHFVGEIAYTCALCAASFTTKGSLRVHIKRQHSESPWTCKHCGEAVEAQSDLVSHLESHNLTKEEKESLHYMPGAPGSGDFDDDSLEDGEEEQETMDSEALSDSIENEASPERDVENLEQTPNSSGMVDTTDVPKEICSICGHEFPASHMAFHMKVHEGQKPYSCPICGKRFGYKNNMKSHIKLHAGIKPYQCSICGAKFTRGSTLRRHARRHGISAESVWDLFVKNSASSQENMLPSTNGSDSTPRKTTSSNMPLHASPDECKEEATSYADSAYSSFFNTPTSVAMSNALFMSYQNHQAAVAAAASSFPSIFNTSLPTPTSEIPLRSSAGFLETSQYTPQANALNLSIKREKVYKNSESQENILSPPTSDEKSWLAAGSSVLRPTVTLAPGVKDNSVDIGIQVNKCCKSSLELIQEGVRSPSEASVHSDHSGSTYQQVSSSGLDNSTESISTLLATGRLYKCDHCECYFSEYAMYRIHSKLHARGGDLKPFACPVCDENCQDKTYFCMHLAEHLR
jgi:DNA-directed RNA polymerase subunit RPC12/RpoP